MSRVAQHVVSGIAAGIYPPGAKLPSLADFIRGLDVGRSAVRGALGGLQALNIVHLAIDARATVASIDELATSPLAPRYQLRKTTHSDAHELAETLFAEAARKAAIRASHSDFQALSVGLSEFELATNKTERSAPLRCLVERLLKAADNSFLATILTEFNDATAIQDLALPAGKETARTWSVLVDAITHGAAASALLLARDAGRL